MPGLILEFFYVMLRIYAWALWGPRNRKAEARLLRMRMRHLRRNDAIAPDLPGQFGRRG